MSLVLCSEIKTKTMKLGRSIEAQVLLNSEPLSDDQLDDIIDSECFPEEIQELMSKHVEGQLDEFIGKKQEQEDAAKHGRLCDEKIADICDLAIFRGNNRTCRISLSTAEKMASRLGIKVQEPDENIIIDDNLLNYDIDDDYWDDYFSVIDIQNTDIDIGYLEDLVGGNFDDLMQVIEERAITLDDIKQIIDDAENMGILEYSYFIKPMRGLLEFVMSTQKRKRKRQN